MTAKEYIIQRQEEHYARLIVDYNRFITCDHVWEEHGFGFLCRLCRYYTGLNTELNTLIKKEAGAHG